MEEAMSNELMRISPSLYRCSNLHRIRFIPFIPPAPSCKDFKITTRSLLQLSFMEIRQIKVHVRVLSRFSSACPVWSLCEPFQYNFLSSKYQHKLNCSRINGFLNPPKYLSISKCDFWTHQVKSQQTEEKPGEKAIIFDRDSKNFSP